MILSRDLMPHINNGYNYTEELGPRAAGRTLLQYLAWRYPHTTAAEWRERVIAGRVLLDGAVATEGARLRAGQKLIWRRPPWQEPDVPLSFAILYRDEYLLAVAKPAGLPTLPGGGEFMDNTLWTLVRRRFPRANPLHRLGRGTSGALLFALTAPVFAALSKSWQSGEVVKIYRALATGIPAENEFIVDTPIGRMPHGSLPTIYAAINEPGADKGRPARSHARVLERRVGATLFEVRIVTGRPHQIRIHLAALGYPLLGDPLYGSGGLPSASSLALPGATGYFLHSVSLGFTHPVTRARIEIFCLPPPPLRLSGV